MRDLLFLVIVLSAVHLPRSSLHAQTPGKLGVQLQAQFSTGWTVRERDALEKRIIDIEVSRGAGLGLQLSYDIAGWIAGYGGVRLDVQNKGPYGSYGAGVLLRPVLRKGFRLNARLGGRMIDLVSSLPYADVGLGGEFLVSPAVTATLELAASVPLRDGTRYTGSHTVNVSAEGGPESVAVGLTWYPDW